MTIRELGPLLRTRRVSCAELVDRALHEAKQREENHWFITLTETQAQAEAAERDEELARGIDRGPLHGIPIALKDLFYTRGIRTTAGSPIYRDFIPDYDATVVERLRYAGAVSIGKTNLHELAFGITSDNPHYGPVPNPRDESRSAGGSSSGSAAVVAAGVLPLALGTDTGGSIRVPASFCGIVGLKPTYGRVSRRGVMPLSFSLDHVGLLATCVEDCALALQAIAGPDPLDSGCSLLPAPDANGPMFADFAGMRIGVPQNFFFERIDGEVEKHVRAAITTFERNGAAVEEVEIPDLREANLASRVIQLAEFAAQHVAQTDSSLFGDDVWSLLEQGRLISGQQYVNAQRTRTLFRRSFDALWSRLDLLVGPTTTITAPFEDQQTVTLGGVDETVRMATTRLVRSMNFLGEPALSMPCGKTSTDLPVGLQLISAPFNEPKLLGAAKTLESFLEPL